MESITFKRFEVGRKTVVDLLTMIAPQATASYVFRDVDMSWARRLRSDFEKDGVKITFTAILLKAIAIAQKAHPMSRSELLPFGRLVTYESIVGGVTVEREKEGSNTVFFAEVEDLHNKTLATIADELSSYVKESPQKLASFAKQKAYAALPYLVRRLIISVGCTFPRLRLKCQKATFGLTSLGKYKMVMALGPCICTSTFAIGTIEDRPVVIDEKIAVRPMMTISLNFNANVLDMPAAAAFLDEVASLMEGRLEEELFGALT